jgi:hypothetical protein
MFYFFIIIIVCEVRLSRLGTATTTGLLYQSQMIDDGDCGAIGGMKIGRVNRSTRRKPVPVPLCPPQIPHTASLFTYSRAFNKRMFKRKEGDKSSERLPNTYNHVTLFITQNLCLRKVSSVGLLSSNIVASFIP